MSGSLGGSGARRQGLVGAGAACSAQEREAAKAVMQYVGGGALGHLTLESIVTQGGQGQKLSEHRNPTATTDADALLHEIWRGDAREIQRQAANFAGRDDMGDMIDTAAEGGWLAS